MLWLSPLVLVAQLLLMEVTRYSVLFCQTVVVVAVAQQVLLRVLLVVRAVVAQLTGRQVAQVHLGRATQVAQRTLVALSLLVVAVVLAPLAVHQQHQQVLVVLVVSVSHRLSRVLL
jgi:hypothetical protein